MTEKQSAFPGYCPYCKEPVVVKGQSIRFHWCKACRVAIDPVSGADVKFDRPPQDPRGSKDE